MDNEELFGLLDEYLTESENEEEKESGCCYNEVNLIYDNYNIICSVCGLTRNGNEFNNETNEEVNFSNPLLNNNNLKTEIYGGKSGNLRKLHKWFNLNSSQRSLLNVYEIIENYSKKLNLNEKIKQDTKVLYNEFYTTYDIKKRKEQRKGVILSCIYYSCKNNENTITLEELSSIFNIKIKIIKKGMKLITENNNKIITEKNNNEELQIIKRFLNDIVIEEYYKKMTFVIYYRIKKLKILSKKGVLSLIGGIVFFINVVYSLGLKKIFLTELLNISQVSLNSVFNILMEYKKIILMGITH